MQRVVNMQRLFAVLVLMVVGLVQRGSAEKLNVAVLDLSSTTLSVDETAAMSLRLRSELFSADSFSIVERDAMEDILKEQGFQQSGCTDANCAVEVGQLLNVQFIISGRVDRVGSLYSVNIRLIDVSTGKVIKTATDDCQRCSLEQAFVQSIKRAALRLSGVAPALIDSMVPVVVEAPVVQPAVEVAAPVQPVVPVALGREVDYKGSGADTVGSLAIELNDSTAELMVNGISYGRGSLTIRKIPSGQHSIVVQQKNRPPYKRVTTVAADSQISERIQLDTRSVHFTLRLGGGEDFYPLKGAVRTQFLLRDSSLGVQQLDLSGFMVPTLALGLGWRGENNLFGFRFCGTPPGAFDSDFATRLYLVNGDERELRYAVNFWNIGMRFDYSRVFRLVGSRLLLEPGVSVGPHYHYVGMVPEVEQGDVAVYRYSENELAYSAIDFGGPRMGVSFGLLWMRLSVEYGLNFMFSSLESTYEGSDSPVGYTVLSVNDGFGVMHKVLFSLVFDL